ncbi:MAG: twin-arginine translocation signal domain-containing protein [Candidatus Kerfeldbacteria bacterium]|nr:twin-arginine translocation signal domain-containing protein [Candidatus Kerfeldbacteria bacterium]
MNRRSFIQFSAAAAVGMIVAGCGRVIAPPVASRVSASKIDYEGLGRFIDHIGTASGDFTVGADGDYDFAVLRIDNGLGAPGSTPNFFVPWKATYTIPSVLAYIRQQFHGIPFATVSYPGMGEEYLTTLWGRTAQPGADWGWQYAIYADPNRLDQPSWEDLVSITSQSVDHATCPRHGTVDCRWSLPL